MNPSDTALLQVHLAEYSALRNEINAFHAIEHQTLNFNIAILAALVGFLAKAGGLSSYRPLILLLVPLPFLLLGFFFGYAQMRIIQVATYIHKQLRSKVQVVLDHDDIWAWEDFRRKEKRPGEGKCPALTLSNSLGFLRWFLFLWPVWLAEEIVLRPQPIELANLRFSPFEIRIAGAVE